MGSAERGTAALPGPSSASAKKRRGGLLLHGTTLLTGLLSEVCFAAGASLCKGAAVIVHLCRSPILHFCPRYTHPSAFHHVGHRGPLKPAKELSWEAHRQGNFIFISHSAFVTKIGLL